MNIDLNALNYKTNFQFVAEYGKALLDVIEALPGAKVIDLGCGNGTLTHMLQEQEFDVIGIDGSTQQLEEARALFPDIPFVHADAVTFEVDEPVDIILSNAMMHWVRDEDQDEMLDHIYKALKPGGEFIFEMGGKGNNALMHAALAKAFEKHGYVYEIPYCLPALEEYASRVASHGFLVEMALFFNRPTKLRGESGAADWIDMFAGRPMSTLPEDLRETVKAEAVEYMRPDLYKHGQWFADYVRLRMKARKHEVEQT